MEQLIAYRKLAEEVQWNEKEKIVVAMKELVQQQVSVVIEKWKYFYDPLPSATDSKWNISPHDWVTVLSSMLSSIQGSTICQTLFATDKRMLSQAYQIALGRTQPFNGACTACGSARPKGTTQYACSGCQAPHQVGYPIECPKCQDTLPRSLGGNKYACRNRCLTHRDCTSRGNKYFFYAEIPKMDMVLTDYWEPRNKKEYNEWETLTVPETGPLDPAHYGYIAHCFRLVAEEDEALFPLKSSESFFSDGNDSVA